MAHEIDTSNGKAAVMVAGQPPWHRLGTNVEQAVVAAEAIRLAGLDWPVQKNPICLDRAHASTTRIESHCAVVRKDTHQVLGVVGKNYEPIQNAEAFEFFDAIAGNGQAIYETAGSLRSGRTIWILARFAESIRVGRTDDETQPYLLLVNTHDGSMALRMFPTVVRVVCQNTLNLAVSRAAGLGISIRHTRGLRERVGEAKRTLGVAEHAFTAFGAAARRLTARTLTPLEVKTYFKELVPDNPDAESNTRTRQIRTRLLENFENEWQSLRGIRHTPWAAWNAVSEWTDHQRTARGKTENRRLNNRLNSIWFGSSAALKRRAFQKALELVAN